MRSVKHYIEGAEGLLVNKLKSSDVLMFVDNKEIEDIADRMLFFNPGAEILMFPDYDTLPFERISASSHITNARLTTLSKLAEPKEKKGRVVVIAALNAALKRLPPKIFITHNKVKVVVGEKLNRDELIKSLVSFGFTRLINACHSSEFSVRGSIIDIVLSDDGVGYRIDFFGDRVESIRTFSTETQKSIDSMQEVTLHPGSEVISDSKSVKRFASKLRTMFGLKSEHLIEELEAGRKIPGQENLTPFFYDESSTIFDFIDPEANILLPYDYSARISSAEARLKELYEESNKIRLHKHEAFFPLPEYSELYMSDSDFDNMLKDRLISVLDPFKESDELDKVMNFTLESQVQKRPAIELFKENVVSNDYKNLIACFSIGSRERMKHMLAEHEIPAIDINTFDEIDKLSSKSSTIGLAIFPINSGVQDNRSKLSIYSEQDILGVRLNRKSKQKKFSQSVFAEFASFQEGELVVHVEHGIGRFEGLQSIEVGHTLHDFARIAYADGDKFYLPVENLELISKFGSSEDAPLDKLGSAQWQLRKAKIRNRIKIAAEQLLKVAAARALLQAPTVEPIEGVYEDFCAKFPYLETEDQLRAIDDVIEDFASNKPMDRLVCGDVGFGKTEVALRAALMAVASKERMQVAVLVPTTLLTRQHYATFSERFSDVPVKIAQLSKFTPRSEIKSIKTGIADGSIDIVIGTHALLAKDVSFNKLGLIIIDEEQHFGVGQKEKLKEIKTDAHVLTLSATPIPRTLQLSLSGIKELSIIATPPVDRLPIKTFVLPCDSVTIREAILREVYRGGRVFYVTPRTMYLDSILEQLRDTVPEVKAQKAHGQMSAAELDKIMNDFYDGKFNVLVSTTIVESGLDIQNANTIIVDRANMFGLSQMYQIRGRVGRSNTQAFAYLTYPYGSRLSDVSEKRLQILKSFDSLGAGFSIASHDMDIRGYGNLVGEEQSGQIKEIGIELYQHMLEEAIAGLKAGQEPEVSEDWSPTLNLKTSVQIPTSYVPDSSLRISLYRRIAAISDPESLEVFASELIDRFGPIPQETEHLITVVKLKHLAKLANIDKMDVGEKAMVVSFRGNQPAFPDKVMEYISSNIGRVKFRDNQQLLISNDTAGSGVSLKEIERIILSLQA